MLFGVIVRARPPAPSRPLGFAPARASFHNHSEIQFGPLVAQGVCMRLTTRRLAPAVYAWTAVLAGALLQGCTGLSL